MLKRDSAPGKIYTPVCKTLDIELYDCRLFVESAP